MLKLYNTLSGKKEEFQPLEEGYVRMYVCGPTVYSSSHLGHARPAVVFDTLRRYLEFIGYDVKMVINFTDVDDKIIKRAQEQNSSEQQISEWYISEYLRDMAALNVKRASHYPKATEHIRDMIELIQVLLDKGYAYKVGEGDVFYRVSKFAGYGKLSGRSLDEIKKSRIEPDERKENPEDFALWKAAKPGEPSWDTPWGKGRPGWHIECSAMSKVHLDTPFDIHGGGKDLIFPHHENEIAQSEAAYDTEMARFWLHNGFINIDKEKMSKSLGNVFNLRNAYSKYPPEALRLFLLQTHYRTDISYSPERLEEATSAFTRILEALERAEDVPAADADDAVLVKFREAMDDDLNTAAALSVVFEAVTALNKAVDAGNEDKAARLKAAITTMVDVCGIRRDPRKLPEVILGQLISIAAELGDNDIPDSIRERLNALGYEVCHSPNGTWKITAKVGDDVDAPARPHFTVSTAPKDETKSDIAELLSAAGEYTKSLEEYAESADKVIDISDDERRATRNYITALEAALNKMESALKTMVAKKETALNQVFEAIAKDTDLLDDIAKVADLAVLHNEELLKLLGEVRALAREEKVFAVSDFIRERLGELGYEIRDLPGGKFEIKRRL